MKANVIRYSRSLKNYSISSMNDFNRVSHISGGLPFRLYHCSTFVTCQIIFPLPVAFICQKQGLFKVPWLLRITTQSEAGGFLLGSNIYGNAALIKRQHILICVGSLTYLDKYEPWTLTPKVGAGIRGRLSNYSVPRKASVGR